MSDKHTYIPALVVLLLILMLAGLADAQEQPISVQITNYPGEGCSAEASAYGFEMRNLGPEIETFTFTVSDHAEYIAFSASELTLAPGETGQLFLFFKTPRDVFGTFSFDFTINAEVYGISAVTPMIHTVDACADYRVELGRYTTTDETVGFTSIASNQVRACQESKLTLPLLITNQAAFANAFDFELEGAEWGSLDGDYMELQPGQQGIVPIVLEAGTQEKGAYQFDLFVTSTIGEITQKLTFFINLDQCFDFSVTLEETEAEICCKERSFKGMVINDGEEDVTFDLLLTGDDWASINKDSLTIPGESNATFTLTLSPMCTDDPDTAGSFTVSAEIDEDGLQASRSASIDVVVHELQTCYDVDVENLDATFNTGVIKNRYERLNTTLLIKNIGKTDVTYDILLDGPMWAWIETHELTIPKGEETELVIITDLFTDIPEDTYPLTLTLTPMDEDIAFQFDFEVDVHEKGFFGKILPWLLWILAAVIILAVVIFFLNRSMEAGAIPKKKPKKSESFYISDKELVKIKKTEEKKLRDTQKSKISGTKGERKLAAQAKKEKREKKAKKEPFELPWGIIILVLLIILLGALLYFYYSSLQLAEETDFDPTETDKLPTGGVGIGMIIDDSVNETETEEEPAEPEGTGEETPEEPVICTADYTPVCGTDGLTYSNFCNLEAAGADHDYDGECVIDEPEEIPEEPEEIPEEPEEPLPEWMTAEFEEGFAYQVFDKNTELVINLSENFNDPDNDELWFDWEGGDNMVVEIEGSIITITPVWDFLGRDKIQFFADDGINDPVASPEVILEVVEPSEEVLDGPVFEMLKAYGWYIFLGIVILIVAIVILKMTEEDDGKPEKKGKSKKRKK